MKMQISTPLKKSERAFRRARGRRRAAFVIETGHSAPDRTGGWSDRSRPRAPQAAPPLGLKYKRAERAGWRRTLVHIGAMAPRAGTAKQEPRLAATTQE